MLTINGMYIWIQGLGRWNNQYLAAKVQTERVSRFGLSLNSISLNLWKCTFWVTRCIKTKLTFHSFQYARERDFKLSEILRKNSNWLWEWNAKKYLSCLRPCDPCKGYHHPLVHLRVYDADIYDVVLFSLNHNSVTGMVDTGQTPTHKLVWIYLFSIAFCTWTASTYGWICEILGLAIHDSKGSQW